MAVYQLQYKAMKTTPVRASTQHPVRSRGRMSFQHNSMPSNDSFSTVQEYSMAPDNHLFSLENDNTASKNCCISPMEYEQLVCDSLTFLKNVGASSNASQIPSENEETRENDCMQMHHHGLTSTPSTLENVARETRTANKHAGKCADCPYVPCLFATPEGGECLKSISCGGVPDHFRDAHGIKDLEREYRLLCGWQGCGRPLTRHNFVRHIRECHLKHSRSPPKSNMPTKSSREGDVVQLVQPQQLYYVGTMQLAEFI
ncbi:hypothetical protein EDC04DRAFT_2642510 [Pisolithus marmoratus]|nr:hypothetical protein EDC04DRAFT_2642510 [Pisolithus marmoratus]